MSKRPSKPWHQSVTILTNVTWTLLALIACGCAETPQQGSFFLSAALIFATNIAFRIFATTNIE